MKSKLLKLLTIIVLLCYINETYSQCEADLAESCCATTNGSFNFTTNNLSGSCQSTRDMGYVVLNVTQGGNLDVNINGDANGGFFDVAVFNIPPGTAPCDVTGADEISCAFAPSAAGCTSFGTTTPGCASNFPPLAVNACDRILILAENFSNTSTTFDVIINDDGDGAVGPPEADIPDAAACLGNPAFQIPNGTDVAGPGAFDAGVDIPGALPGETGADVDACPNAAGGTYTATCGACVTATGMFDPTVAGAGTHTVTYEHYTTADTDPDGNCCYAMDVSTITVDADPDPQLACPAGPVCTSDGMVPTGYVDANAALATNGAPAVAITGSGAPFVAADMFDPAASGPGTFTIIYTLTSVNGLCEDVVMCDIMVEVCCPDIAPAIAVQEICTGTDPDFVVVETEVNATGPNMGPYSYFLDAGFATPYASPTNLTCAPINVTIYGRLQCSAVAAGDPDEFDDFMFDVTVYPDANNFAVAETSGDCGVAAMVSITAENGDECFAMLGTAPVDPGCDNPDDVQDLMYMFDPGFIAACNATFSNTVPASCATTAASSDPAFTCPPNLNFCQDNLVIDLNNIDNNAIAGATGVFSGSGAQYVIGNQDPGTGTQIDLSNAPVGVTLTLEYTVTAPGCPPVTTVTGCTFNTFIDCDADGGSFPSGN